MQKLLSIFVYLILLIFLESAAEVTGVPASAPAELPEEPNYVALTFDDGPSDNTEKLLDILQQYRIKATFFTVGKDGYDDVYRRIVGDGHTLGMHSYSHDYSKVYSSVEAFGRDFEKIYNHIELSLIHI